MPNSVHTCNFFPVSTLKSSNCKRNRHKKSLSSRARDVFCLRRRRLDKAREEELLSRVTHFPHFSSFLPSFLPSSSPSVQSCFSELGEKRRPFVKANGASVSPGSRVVAWRWHALVRVESAKLRPHLPGGVGEAAIHTHGMESA